MERRMLCPICGARPTQAVQVIQNEEIVEKHWWCVGCQEMFERPMSAAPSAVASLRTTAGILAVVSLLSAGFYLARRRTPRRHLNR